MTDTIPIATKMEAYVTPPPTAAPATPEKEAIEMKSTTEIEPKGKRLARARKALKTAKAKSPKARKAKPAKVKEAKPRGAVIKFRGDVKCKAGDSFAAGEMTEDGLIIRAGSHAIKKVNETINENTPSRFKTRNDLIQDGTLEKEGKYLRFTRNFLFSSPTVAACTVQGTSANGLIAWRCAETGKTLKELA